MGYLILWLSLWFIGGIAIHNFSPKKSWVMTIGGSLVGSLMIFAGGIYLFMPKDTSTGAGTTSAAVAPAPDQDQKLALAAAETEISKKLLTPGAAKYDMDVLYHDGNKYIVHATVDSQNAFGALLRGHFCARVEIIDATHYKGGAVECMENPTKDYIDMLKYASF